ncbi:MAG TPA: hypothetical protein VMG34_13535 [Bacteroidota bacterium]|nr:hypothetical protein [Bacteroidota bacterium]
MEAFNIIWQGQSKDQKGKSKNIDETSEIVVRQDRILRRWMVESRYFLGAYKGMCALS